MVFEYIILIYIIDPFPSSGEQYILINEISNEMEFHGELTKAISKLNWSLKIL